MKYIEVTITLGQNDPYRDLLVDALGNEGPYDSFVETPNGLKAYVQESLFDEGWLKEQLADINNMTSCSYSFESMPDKNWNEEWEKQHKPVLVEAANGKRVWVRAPFHEHRSDVDYEIEIEPKMSFGTAHHQTTYMMLSYLTELEVTGKSVLDMGCGTAVLAILAKLRGAAYVEAIDIDEWAYNNALENAQRNGVELNVRIGDAALLGERQFDLIIANINRNILLNDMAAYVQVLEKGGTLLLSGFYESDVPVLQHHAESLGLRLEQQKVRQSWTALRLVKL
jgi:ribosomal protein L11 methyltransferase